MHKTGKKLLSVLLALAMVLSLLPGAALLAAADDVTYVQITSTPTAETLANMITYSQDDALVIYNSAEFQAGAGPNGGIVLIYNVGEADGEYMVIHNAQGTPEVMSMALDTIGMLLQYGFNVYIVQPGGSEPPPDPPANPAVYYQYYTLNTADWSITPVVESTTNYTLVTSSNSNWNSGWYVVSGDVTINELVEFSGTVRLILCDGASLTVTEGIWPTANGSKLIIYPGVMDSGAKAAPSIEGSGALHANASYPSEPGIGGNETLELEIHGGVIEATGGNGAAGIGGGYGRNGCTVTIYGGSVTATGGSNGAGIGGADGANGGNVSIYGGTVNAIGGPFAVGIGAGYEGVSDGALNFNSEGILLETSDDNLSWSVYSDGAPRGRYMRAQVINEQPAAIPSADEGFFDDFEGEFTWTIQNGGQTNAWYLGEAVNNGGSKALYVSNDGGASNTYTVYKSSFVFVEKTFSFEGGYYNFAYDWRGDGETAYDFIRMALIPVDFEVTAGSTYPLDFSADGLPEGWIAIDGGAKLNLQSEWQHDVYEDVQVPAGLYRAAIIWVNDTSAGTQPAGAIDNFSIAPVNYTPVEGPVSADEGYTEDFEGINTWTLHNGEQINAWYVGDAVNNGGGKALYVSKDGGFTNAYDIDNYSFAFADKLFRFDGGAYDFAYDWRCGGEANWDYLRVALIPEDAEPVPGEEPNGFAYRLLPSGWISLDNDGQLVNQTDWQHLSIEGLEVPAGDYYVAFFWRNDDSDGSEIPAAIDNFSVTPVNYTPVEGPVSADEGYTEDFEGENTWKQGNEDQTNRWIVGEAVSNGGSKSLYISNDDSSHRYSPNGASFTFAEKALSFAGGEYDFSYDWICNGEENYDYLRVALVPESAVLTPGVIPSDFDNSLPEDWISLDQGSFLCGSIDWQTMNLTKTAVPEGVYRVGFFWTNDPSVGNQPPAAIDNFSVEPHIDNPQTVDVYLIDQTNVEPSDVRIWAWGSAGDLASSFDARPAMEYQDSDAVVNREGVNGEPYTRPYYKFTLNVDDFGDGLLFTNPNGQSANCALTAEQKEAGFAVFYLYYADNGLGAGAGNDVWKLVSHTDADCTQPAIDEYRGLLTDESDSIERSPALGHDFSILLMENLPTCTTGGFRLFQCSRCDETQTEALDPLDHIPGEPAEENVIPATCTEAGSYDLVVRCEICGEILNSEPITVDALGHDFGEWSVSEEPSCTESGEEIAICARCGEIETRPVDALGHDYVPAVTEPSCTEGGFTTYTCSRCGDSYEDDFTEALGHDFGEWTVTAEPSCTEAGEEVRICARCGETETQTLDALGHDYRSFTFAPTCTRGGSTTYTCLRCGDSYVEYTDPLGHDFSDLIEEHPATCTEDGYSVYRCSRCGETETRTVEALSHDYVPAVTEPSCTEGGFTTYTCSRCGDSYEADLTDALGHNPGEPVQENYVEPTATEEGGYDMVVYCQRCGAELERAHTTLPATGPAEPIEIDTIRIFPSIGIGIETVASFSVRSTELSSYESWYIEVSKLDGEGNAVESKRFGAGQDEDVELVRDATWRAVYRDITAKEMGVPFTAEVHAFAANGQEYISRNIISDSPIFTIRDYVIGELVNEDNADATRKLAADLLNYGAAAQVYFGFDTENLVNENLSTEAQAAMNTFAATGEAPAVLVNNANSANIFSSVSVMNRITLTLSVRGFSDAGAVQIEIKNHETGAVKEVIDAEKVSTIWRAKYSGFEAEDMRTAFDFTVIADGSAAGTPITWSVEGYAREARLNEDSTEEELNLFNALLHYVDSCVAVFAN